jgi:hypothetical protein
MNGVVGDDVVADRDGRRGSGDYIKNVVETGDFKMHQGRGMAAGSVRGPFNEIKQARAREDAKKLPCEYLWSFGVSPIRLVEDAVINHVSAMENQFKDSARLILFDGPATLQQMRERPRSFCGINRRLRFCFYHSHAQGEFLKLPDFSGK